MNTAPRASFASAAVITLVAVWSAVASPATPAIPFTPTPAVSDRVLLGLVATDRDIDLVSPPGIDAVLCALTPVMSEAAQRQRRAASESDCRPPPPYIHRSIWFSPALPPDPRGEVLLRSQAEIHHETFPLNPWIERWLITQNALPVPLQQPIEFAALSVLDYARGWEYPFTSTQPPPLLFHGRRRDVLVPFLVGRQLASVGDRSCVRGVIPIHLGGAVFVTEIGNGPPAAAIRCLSRALDPQTLVNAQFYIPQLSIRHTDSLIEGLKRVGLTDIFNRQTDPFPKLFHHQRIDEAIQASELTMDWKGIRIRSATIVDIVKGRPHFEAVLAYDRPFALRVVDDRGATVAVAIVNDL